MDTDTGCVFVIRVDTCDINDDTPPVLRKNWLTAVSHSMYQSVSRVYHACIMCVSKEFPSTPTLVEKLRAWVADHANSDLAS